MPSGRDQGVNSLGQTNMGGKGNRKMPEFPSRSIGHDRDHCQLTMECRGRPSLHGSPVDASQLCRLQQADPIGRTYNCSRDARTNTRQSHIVPQCKGTGYDGICKVHRIWSHEIRHSAGRRGDGACLVVSDRGGKPPILPVFFAKMCCRAGLLAACWGGGHGVVIRDSEMPPVDPRIRPGE